MSRKKNRMMQYYIEIMNNLIDSKEASETIKHETKLIGSLLVPMMVCAGMINLFIGMYWDIPVNTIIIFFLILELASLGLYLVIKANIKVKWKIHINSALVFVSVIFTFYTYYNKINVLFWFILMIVTVLAGLSTDRTPMVYLAGTYVGIFIYVILNYRIVEFTTDHSFYLALLFLLVFFATSTSIVNHLFRRIIAKKMHHYSEISSQKDELTALYEEILANEETLKDQNRQLNEYNAQMAASNERLEFLSYNDPLTGLPNRKMIMEQLELMIELDTDNDKSFALVFIDVDNFKRINDSLGHYSGDILLTQVAKRFADQIHKKDLLGRLGGDELALLIRRQMIGEDLLEYVQGLCDLFETAFDLDGVNTRISASFGIAIWPMDADNANDLLKAADTAMYKAKEIGKKNVQFYRKEMKGEILTKMEIENRMIKALERNEFFLEYQPIFGAQTGEIRGFEALIRWESPQQGRISPMQFIPIAEENGFISEIGAWVLKKVCHKSKEVREYYKQPIRFSVNVSAVQLKSSEIVEQLIFIVKQEEVDPSEIELEITESVFIHDKETAVNVMHRLKEAGFAIAMDDFGTGYSSLSYLLELPIDKLKIDKSFVDVICDGNKKKEIVGAIIDMVHSLDMIVVAEGVETKEQLEYLRNENCDLIQGFLLGRPLGDEEIKKLLLKQ